MEKQRSMRKIFLILVMMLFAFMLVSLEIAHGEDNIRLAILDFTITSQESEHKNLDKIVAEWLTTFLVETQAFEVVERRELQKVLQEQSLGQTGMLEPESAAQVGEILGVNILVTGTLINLEDSLEITTRLVNATNGAIVGAVSVTADDIDELRDQIKELTEIIERKLSEKLIDEDIKILETFDEDKFNTTLWRLGFDEEVKEADRNNTKLSQENGILKITGKYREEDGNRFIWITPISQGPYQSIEVKIRVCEIDGGASVCLGANWNDDTSWTAICLYFEEGYGDVNIGMEDVEETEQEFDFDVQLNQWYLIRLEYKDNQFHYYYNDQLIKRNTLVSPIGSLEELEWDVGFPLNETEAINAEIDEIILR